MADVETSSLWSQIFGEAVEGELKGERLEAIPSGMLTWKAWRAQYPETTALDLSRTSRAYTKEFYRRPDDFVFGWIVKGKPYHCSFATLRKHPVLNLTLGGQVLLLSFDQESTSCRLFFRRLDDRQLSFVADRNALMRDRQTGSLWNRTTGVAVKGSLKDRRLEHRVGIVSYTHKWQFFHPNSEAIERP